MMTYNLMISHNNDEVMQLFLYKSTDLKDINGIELMILLIIHFYLENDDDRIGDEYPSSSNRICYYHDRYLVFPC